MLEASNPVMLHGKLPEQRGQILAVLDHIITDIGEKRLRDYRRNPTPFVRHLCQLPSLRIFNDIFCSVDRQQSFSLFVRRSSQYSVSHWFMRVSISLATSMPGFVIETRLLESFFELGRILT